MACQANMIAQMKRRVTLQSPSRVSDGQGGYNESWADVATLWASIKPVKGYERIQAMQTETPLTHSIMIRYRAGVNNTGRLIYQGRVFVIKQVIDPNEDKAFLQLLAVEMAS